MPRFRMIHVDHYMCRPIAPFDDLKSELRAIQDRDPDDQELIKKIASDIEKSLAQLVEDNQRKRQQQQQQQQPEPGPSRERQPTTGPTDVLEQDAESNLEARLLQERAPILFLGQDQKAPIHKIERVKSYNYYGYHNEPEDFLKLYLYNPRMVKPLAQLFEDCKVLGRFIPVFWAHLPYILLFFIDNNLRGMQYLDVDQLYWRRDKAPRLSTTPFSPVGPQTSRSSVNSMQADVENFTTEVDPISTCELEADIRYEWILNKQRFGSKGNVDALRELWLDDQESTQTSSVIDPELPLYNLERDYIEQLCEEYGVDYRTLNLEVEQSLKPSQLRPNEEPNLADSDDSLDFLLKDREDEIVNKSSDTPKPPEELKSDPPDEGFSDDEEFLRDLPAINSSISNSTPVAGPSGKPIVSSQFKLIESQSKILRQEDGDDDDQFESSPETKPNILSPKSEEDEFSDDDQDLIEAIIEAESRDPSLRSQNLSDAKQPKAPRKRYSDNSMIDGRSIACSTNNRSKTQSQRSSSSRETVSHEYQYLCLMSMELHFSTRDKLRPDPAFDPIEVAFYCVRNDAPETSNKSSQVIGMIITDPFKDDAQVFSPGSVKSPGSRSNMSYALKMRTLLHRTGLSLDDIELFVVDTELELIMKLVEVVRSYDPEILLGYEMEQLSWGYLLERSSFLNINVGPALSRVSDSNFSNNSKVVESNFVQPIMFTGRMVFSTWHIIRHEINLNTCSYERIHHHALNERVPCYSFKTLTRWFTQNCNRWRVIDYYLIRIVGQMRILDRFDLMAKVSELARVYGTQFIDVITRGSQIGIESMMLRLAKLQNLTPLSPTVMQRNKMKAPEALPLVMEPETNIYYDPVAVLDFQSLYPSVVIAYNYCYSTCLGRVMDLEKKQRHQFGCSQLHVDEKEVKRLLETKSVHVSPCGVAYVKKKVRHGVLPKMLKELIMTRAMVKDQMKKNMKSDRPNRRLQRILDHRQHGLKMMANTTYGYTGASYTGRMPCVEIADSIVSKGRETLENAIELVESRPEWGAKVIYGDTDSIFIQFKGCSRDEAFRRAYEMVDAITAQNPYPIKMKFEKIYQPCVLQTKKRYCGFKYEAPEQARPEFEAKGIETIRRDCCPAAARMLEMALRIQFTTRDINEVKRYVQHQFVKIMSGKLSNIQDFIFARRYKPRDLDKQESVFVPAWQITKRLLQVDPRSEPRLNERVPFVIIYGEPRTPLVNLAKTPIEVLENLSYRINSDYYIQKIICPTLNRVFCTMKVDTLLWYKSMPHQNLIHRSHYLVAQKEQDKYLNNGLRRNQQCQSTMSQFFSPSHCPVCAKSIPLSEDICDSCRSDLQSSVVRMSEEIRKNQRKLFAYHQICRACSSLERSSGSSSINYPLGNNNNDDDDIGEDDEHYNPCISYDCQNLFRYHQAKLDALNSNYLTQILKALN